MEAAEAQRGGPEAQAKRSSIPAAAALLALVLAVFAAGWISDWPVKPPACLLKSVTGIPCPGCGGTRAFASLADGDAVRAIALNPLAVAAAGGVVLWFVFAMIARGMPEEASAAVRRVVGGFGKGWLILGIVAAIANWIYLIVYLE